MGTWTDKTDEAIAEASAGAGKGSAWRYPEPGEGYQFDVERTDAAGDSDPWRVALEVSVDPTSYSNQNPPLRGFRLQASQTRISVPVRGPIYACRIWIQNDDGTPTDVVAATIRWRRDAVSI